MWGMRKEECIGSFKFARSLLKFVLGLIYTTKLGHGSWESLDFHWLIVVQAPTLGLNKDNSDYNT